MIIPRYYLDREAYETLPPGRPRLLRARFEPKPPPRSPEELFPFPIHDDAEFSDSYRQELAKSSECAWESVFWAEGKDQDQIEGIGRPYIYPDIDERNGMVGHWHDILAHNRWDELTENILQLILVLKVREVLRRIHPYFSHSLPKTPEAWWEAVLEQISEAKKDLRKDIPDKYLRFHAVLHEKNLASLVYIRTIHHLRGSYNQRLCLRPHNVEADLNETKQYFERHAQAIEVATAAARKRLIQHIKSS